MNSFLGWASGLGLALSLAVQVASLAGVDLSSRFPWVWLLHVGIFVVLVPFALVRRKSREYRIWPTWATAILAVALGYSFLTFFLVFRHSGGGGPAITNGEFVLQSHGRVTAHLTEPEYHAQRAYELRLFSAGWILFYSAPALYAWSRARRQQ